MPGTVNCSFIDDVKWDSNAQPGNSLTIWYGNIAQQINKYNQCYALLNADEQTKANRFRQQKDKERYVLQHGFLRQILERYTGIKASELTFGFNTNKKPFLTNLNKPACHFNLSNSNGHFLIAVGDSEIGVDIEKINQAIDYRDIASLYFGGAESAYINNSNNPAQAFYTLWTRKEALLKACGMGIDDNLPAVPALDGLHNLPPWYPVKDWATQSFLVAGDFMVSITTPATLQTFQLSALNNELF